MPRAGSTNDFYAAEISEANTEPEGALFILLSVNAV